MIRARVIQRLRRRDPWSGLPARSTLTAVGEYRIHSVEFGDHEDAVVLVHGLAGSAQWWSRNVSELCTRYRVVVPDLIGFGRTARAGRLPRIARVAEVLCSWQEALGLERAHLIGHSMGGQIAAHLAARFPQRLGCLVLVDSAGVPRPLRPRHLARSAASMAPPQAWGDPLFLRTIAEDALLAGPRTLAQALYHIVRDDVRPLLPQISARTLVVWGERDRLVPVEDAAVFRALIPNARQVVIPGAAHNPMVDRPSVFNRIVLRFLQGEPVGW
jgi:pimeloyl-ACP methyl ester carboxylesterase